MASLLANISNPARWWRFLERSFEGQTRRRLSTQLDAAWKAVGPVPIKAQGTTLLADGMWFNPNHFFRLRLFCQAIGASSGVQLVGVLRRRDDRDARRALERIGFREFIWLEEDREFRSIDFVPEARRLLSVVRNHRDLLALQMPEDIPAYVLYDTVLKLARHPQPPIEHPLWCNTLAELLRNAAIYARELACRNVAHVVLSHPWKSEWAALVWIALGRAITTYHLTGFVEGMRIRRFRSRDDYATPVESLPPARFDALAPGVQAKIVEFGKADFERRISGRLADINASYAFHPEKRIDDRGAARCALSGQSERPIAVVYSHVWYDFPHTFAMRNFTDFLDWIEVTIARCRSLTDRIWLLKPHPMDAWYGGFRLADVARDLPPHIRLLPLETDSATAMLAADAVVTVHGTIGLEAAAAGVPVLLADRSYFSDWGVATVAQSRDDYLRLLGEVSHLPTPDATVRRRAQACFALALAGPPEDAHALRMTCDSRVSDAYREILQRLAKSRDDLAAEQRRIEEWLAQDEVDGFAAYHLLAAARRKQALVAQVTPA